MPYNQHLEDRIKNIIGKWQGVTSKKMSRRDARVARTYGKGKRLLVIENVPIVSCPHCGESYLTAETIHEIERLKVHQNSLATERRVRTLAFA
jgi:YgiT-type zinc finger domain-containing protein